MTMNEQSGFGKNIPVFVSLTAIHERLYGLEHVLTSLLRQSVPPDKIILNISDQPFLLDKGIKKSDLPLSVQKMQASGQIEIHFVENTGPYRKILPTLERYAGAEFLVATVDDDVVYPPDWLKGLVDAIQKYKCVAAYRCRLMNMQGGEILPYNTWPLINEQFVGLVGDRLDLSAPSFAFFPTGRDGVIYHSSFFPDMTMLRELSRLAPFQDDIALKFATLNQQIPVSVCHPQQAWVSEHHVFSTVAGEDGGLWAINQGGENDLALKRVLQYVSDYTPA
ncbi:hypothetical protein [Acetobacter sp. LMG 32666]|uniref:hypothetical protein n=1 Tax=Acetobacter sp. LMG 32666 TaxID=2959295 RepID=UPI0030C7AC16